jgi:CO/xanthine dehydrogenase Mo-binding subunit
MGAFASRAAVVAGTAIALATDQVREKAKMLAAELLEAAREDLRVEDGRVFVKGSPGHGVGLGELAVRARAGKQNASLPDGRSPGLEATSHFSPSQITFSSGAHAAIVRVDAETGGISVERYAIVHDCGKVINPMIVEGQMHGGAAHGISEALFEHARFDGCAQPLATTLMDYLLVTAAELPPLVVDHVETASPGNPLGIKGAGESGIIPVHAAIASAVEDALRPLGVRITSLPIVPSDLVRMIARAAAPAPPAR